MAGTQINEVAYTLTQPLSQIPLLPIVAQRAPKGTDKAPIGSEWIDQPANTIYILTSITNNNANWQQIVNAGGGGMISTYSLQTNDGNPHALISLPIANNQALNITGSIMAADAGFANSLGGSFSATFERAGGGLALIGFPLVQTVDTTNGAVTIAFAAVGNNATANVTGQNATVWNWKASVILTYLP